ncbi:N-acetyltransferase [Mycobacterium intermedium]|uniref:Lysine N-acyltransferase MbtK n=1 Tax=Mycobacterium intermedium TaxID=28445 RepID=A0A1E3SAQ4_MYCIE|nr:acetyltransferase [Mycobacterium intermedium]ODQ99246.1 GNAT family N-acetyltransferase [Mycobacterium intermedium]OPE49191.1 N-acetyltransferase [Mycobacterium intermedium]ORB05930.1 N-acetyltransferase [Mycobacterium intermedium]
MDVLDLGHRQATLHHDTFGGTFSLRRMDLSRDLDQLHSWMNDPEVARFWKKAWPRAQVASYLRLQNDLAHSVPHLGELDGVAMSYWELYRADLDPLAEFYAARGHDAGIHVLLGPAEYRGRGLASSLLRIVSDWQLEADPLAERVVAEPDVSNARSIRAFERAGFRRTTELDLPDKRAVLMVRDRAGR